MSVLDVLAVWLVVAALTLAGWVVVKAPERARRRHEDEAIAVANSHARHPSGRWAGGPVPLEDSEQWGAR